MALNSLAPNPDFVQRTAESRKITRTLVGEYNFDRFIDNHRHRVFLPRNMTQVLAFHDRKRLRGIESGTFRSPSTRSRGPFFSNGITTKKAATDDPNVGVINQPDLKAIGNDASNTRTPTTATPDVSSMSQDCLKVKVQTGSVSEPAMEKRRSVRHQLSRQHEDKNAQLYLDLINIRKKLNFKESTTDVDTRPKKRIRRESISCHCHITIWDNRQSDKKEPIVRKSEPCEISTSELGAAGYVAEIKLSKPFVFKASELKIPIETPGGSVLGVGNNYFLEIKIIPTRDDVEWPPVPVLGRSEGDQTTGLGRMAAEKLQNALCAKYMYLPQAPASDVPLSVFYLHDGRTYRSKYGLEVNAMWTKGEMPEVMLKHEEDEVKLDLWALDDEGRSFGRRDSPDTKVAQASSASKPRNKAQRIIDPPVKVIFNIDAASAKGAKDFRKSSTTGLRCPACPNQSFKNVEDLQFHFTTSHSKFKFVVEKQELNPATNELISIVFKMSSIGTTRPRNQDREARKNERNIDWQAPLEPLDVPAYVNGDQSWVEQNWVEGPPKPEPAAAINVAPDKLSAVRQAQRGSFAPAQKGGFLPAEHVSPFRAPTRKQYPNIKLRTMTTDKETMYTSISHRQVGVGEEARSESDDEMDDGWFVKKSLEALDLAAEKHEWTNEQRMLRRKWNQARLREKLSHPRYLSDCLIRFVRAEKTWLNAASLERKATLADFLDELLQRRVINQEVLRDVWIILYNDEGINKNDKADRMPDVDMGDLDKVVDERPAWGLPDLTPRQSKAEAMLQLPSYTCAVCVEAIDELRRRGVRCSEHECEAPGVWYHTQCVRCKRKDRLGWKCQLCIERLEVTRKAKGKEAAVD